MNKTTKPEDIEKKKIQSRIHRRFDKEELWRIEGFPLEKVLGYDERFNAEDIQVFMQSKCDSDVANRYDKRFKESGLHCLVIFNCDPEKADTYGRKYDGIDITSFVRSNLTPEQVRKYNFKNKRFTANEIADLIQNNILPEETFGYHKHFDGKDIICFKELGLNAQIINLESQIRKYKLLDRLSNWRWNERENLEKPMNKTLTKVLGKGFKLRYEFIAEGSTSIVLLRQQNEHKPEAYKFMIEGSAEIELLKKLKKRNKNVIRFYDGDHVTNPPKNLDQIFNPPDHVSVEYIKGKTIDRYLQEDILAYQKIVKYSKGILNGLLELRSAGIYYHRDINPKNIIIREKKDEAVIIDLGYATDDPKQHHIEKDPDGKYHNRRFNGPNDLSSLGQLMYYMATGTSVFATTTEHKKDLSDIADEINANRRLVYKDKSNLKMNEVYRKIDANITDNRLSLLIKECLTAKHTDYDRIYAQFQKMSL